LLDFKIIGTDMSENKFENIKVGDCVLCRKYVSTGGYDKEVFWITAVVEHVTPKQFTVNGNKYRKSDGYQVSSKTYREYVFNKGDNYCGKKITDQSEEMNALIKNVNTLIDINNILCKLKISYNNENLDEILLHVKKINELIK